MLRCSHKRCYLIMRTASVRQLKNQTSELLRRSANEDVIITSRGRPVACLVGIHPQDIDIRPRVRPNANEKQKRELSRLLTRIWKLKTEKGKKWISQEHHDRVLYGESGE
jgi:prevent-host-death family protein